MRDMATVDWPSRLARARRDYGEWLRKPRLQIGGGIGSVAFSGLGTAAVVGNGSAGLPSVTSWFAALTVGAWVAFHLCAYLWLLFRAGIRIRDEEIERLREFEPSSPSRRLKALLPSVNALLAMVETARGMAAERGGKLPETYLRTLEAPLSEMAQAILEAGFAPCPSFQPLSVDQLATWQVYLRALREFSVGIKVSDAKELNKEKLIEWYEEYMQNYDPPPS